MLVIDLKGEEVLVFLMAANDSDVDDDTILKYWRDIDFPGSFGGVKTFQALLKSDLNIDVSEKKLYNILKKDQIFLLHQIKSNYVNRRNYITHHYGEIVQADVAFMFPDPTMDYKYFLLVIDVYSNKIFVEPLKDKSSATVAKQLETIFKSFGSPIYKLETDKGTEFTGKECKTLFKDLKIFFKTKKGLHKASFAESAIKRVKRKLFMFLRSQLTQKWTTYIQKVVDGINSIPLKRIGYLTPNSIQSVADSVKVDKSLKEHGLNIPKRSSYIEQKQNSEEYLRTVEKDSNLLKIGDYVYIRFKKDPMMKSFDLQVQTLQL